MRRFAAFATALTSALAGCSGDASSAGASRASLGDAAPVATAQASPAYAPSAPIDPGRARVRDSIRYLALGDSFTIGTGSSPAEAFPARLAQRLERMGAATPVSLENLGVNGFTTEDLERVELPRVRAFAPSLVTLAIGANDLVHGATVDAYRTNVRRILNELGSLGVPSARIVCLPQPAWGRSPTGRQFGDPAAIERKIDAFNAAFREEAARAGAVWADLAEELKAEAERGMFAPDGLHPNAAAHDAWAEQLLPFVAQALGEGSGRQRRGGASP